MAFNQTLSAILRGRWLLDKQWANDHLPLVLMMLQGNPVSFVERTGNEGVELPFVVDPATMDKTPLIIYDYQRERFVSNPNIPINSVGVIPISGPITKYNGDCGEPGAMQRNNWLLQIQKSQNISSVVFLLDTPGGESRAASSTISILQKFNKPKLGFIDGMSASLGVWYTSAMDEVYLSNDMDQIGSIGSYCSILDFSGYLEMNGIKLIEVYAPQSTDKNKDYRDALAGDTSRIEADLKMHVDNFISFVKNSRGGKAAANEKNWSSGKMFYAKEGIANGLADGIRPFDQVISKAAWLAKRNK